jgi:hypothetical protein
MNMSVIGLGKIVPVDAAIANSLLEMVCDICQRCP